MITDWTRKKELSPNAQGALSSVGAQAVPLQRYWFTIRVVLLTSILLLLALGALLYALNHHFAHRIYPNVSIHGVAVGQLGSTEVYAQLEEHHAPFLNQPLTLQYGEHTWTPTLEEIGVELSTDEAIVQALRIGRVHPDRMDNIREVMAVWKAGTDIPLHIQVDQRTMQRYLLGIADEIEQLPQNAQLVVRNGHVDALPAVHGQQMLVASTMDEMLAALQTLQPQSVEIRTQSIPALLLDAHIAEAQREIEVMLQGPIKIVANNAVWEWSVEELSQMMRVHRVVGPHGDDLEITLDQHQIRERLHTIANITEYGGEYPRVDWADGALNILQNGTPVMRVDIEQSLNLIIEAAQSSTERTVHLPFSEARPAINQHNIHELGIRHLLGVGHSDFSGSAAYRTTNIMVGMERLNGILLAPGEEFSFNRTVGNIGPENGFVPGYAIVGEEVELEWGGGICQDSTTMFRAAFWSGLPITERKGHSYYINWYDTYGYGDYGHGPGIDATIFTGAQDFKFINDTGHWILIQTRVDPWIALAEVRIYGTDTGREVMFEGPFITGSYEDDLTVNFTRVIHENGIERREPFVTIFEPWPEDTDH